MIIDFVENNDIDNVKKEIALGVNKWVDQFGYSVLHIALSKGFDEIASLLIEGGIDTNLQDLNGQTALHYCAFYNKTHLAKEILDNNGRLDIQDKYGNQPLWTAVINDKGFGNRVEIVELFILRGADFHHKNKVGESPISAAKDLEYDEVLAAMQK